MHSVQSNVCSGSPKALRCKGFEQGDEHHRFRGLRHFHLSHLSNPFLGVSERPSETVAAQGFRKPPKTLQRKGETKPKKPPLTCENTCL